MKTLDLNNPKDAREFIKEAVNDCVEESTGSRFTYVILKSGVKKNINKLSDSEAVQYAFELLPIFQARHPDRCDIKYEQ